MVKTMLTLLLKYYFLNTELGSPGAAGGGRGGSDLTATLADISMRVSHLMSLLGSCQVISLSQFCLQHFCLQQIDL